MRSLLNEVVRDLEQHKNVLRIRKMLFCATRNQWENNREILLAISLRDLVQEVIDLNSTVDQLSISLYEIVKSLNRQTEYLLVANTIISFVGKLYDETEEATQIVAFKPQQYDAIDRSSNSVQSIARSLDTDLESLRIRKLLYCLCNNRWSNEAETVLKVTIGELVERTYQLYPTLSQLALSLQGIVDSLNRKTEYSSVANIIVHNFEQLYDATGGDTLHTAQTTGVQEQTQPQAASARADVKEVLAPTVPLEVPIASPPISGTILPTNPLEAWDASVPFPQDLSELNAQLAKAGNTYDPFAVRLEVIKYSNPLRAKILTFSLLEHKFDYKGKDWSSLRTIELDELLLSAYQKYKTLPELETQLYEIAQTLDDPNESFQAASAIAKALKPFYR
ncbi:hypothetical protein [Oscillatoria sp. FACHB-1406]|uniref:hypothetical protein n=1 Tax=Oscillatoria sp. FACHB-1406 TaxID=2692846 RepID=UPI001A7EC8CD|nr:hypothetical protein [Oscillatoria sp. FACHB-1406]